MTSCSATQSSSFHDSHYLRQVLGLKPAPEFALWLEKMRITGQGRLLAVEPRNPLLAYATDLKFRNLRSLHLTEASDSWADLRRFTPARIAIGRSGGSQRTPSLLDFRLSHARARDAVWAAFDTTELDHSLKSAGLETIHLTSKAQDRRDFLLRPDHGRALAESCTQTTLQGTRNQATGSCSYRFRRALRSGCRAACGGRSDPAHLRSQSQRLAHQPDHDRANGAGEAAG